MKQFLLFFVLSILAFTPDLLAQSDTTITIEVAPPDAFPDLEGKSVVEVVIAVGGWLISNWDAFLGWLATMLVALSVVLRQWPTTKNVDVLMRIVEFLDRWRLTKNRRKTGGRFVAKTEEQED
jgi:hypothetical protein